MLLLPCTNIYQPHVHLMHAAASLLSSGTRNALAMATGRYNVGILITA